jgi:AraC-like DNA-binding protein
MDHEIYNDLVPEIHYFIHRISTPTWLIEESRIDFVDLTYIVGGRAEYSVDSVVFPVKAGDLVCIPSGALRSAIGFPEDPVESYCVNGRMRLLSGGDIKLPFPVKTHIGMHPEIIDLCRELNAEWLSRDTGYGMRVRAIWLMILQRYFQLIVYKNDPSTVDNRIRKVLRYVIDHYTDPLTVQGMADLIGLSPWYFGNFFKKETGVSFRQYLTSIRLNHAEDMLRSGEYNVSEVAAACGFSNIFYFCKVFKESRGITPSRVIRSGKIENGERKEYDE